MSKPYLPDAREDDMRVLLTRPEFRRFLAWHLAEAGIFRASFSADGGASLRSEGRRSLGIEVFDLARRADPRVAAQLIVELTPTPKEKPDDRRHGGE